MDWAAARLSEQLSHESKQPIATNWQLFFYDEPLLVITMGNIRLIASFYAL